ncbi:hypothetical protein [Vreelandella zhaodongensis]|uniref:hypothetical protein n=1 Tax=Vreelandella zhaodongensis TaxID=1176240 RepID=UPI003EB9B0C0
MLIINAIKKTSALGALMALVASPAAFAHSSIELNQDRSVGQIVHASSERASVPAPISYNDLMYDKGDRQSDQAFLDSGSKASGSQINYIDLAEVRRETEGGSGDHY